MRRRLTSNTTTTVSEGNGEELLLPPRPIVWIIGTVAGLRDEHDLARGVMLQEVGIDARNFSVVTAKLIEGSRAWNVLEFAVFDDSERHGDGSCELG